MQKIIMTVILILTVTMIGCSSQSNDDLKSENVSNPPPTQTLESDYQMSGITLSSERDLVDNLKSQNLFNSFSAKTTESDYQITGTVYLSSERNLVEVDANADTEISISGTLERKEGEIKLLIEDVDGNITTLIDSESNQENTMEVDLSLPLNAGRWRFYFSGTSCIFNFNLNFGTQEEVNYYLNNM